jgi:hypothetical protein
MIFKKTMVTFTLLAFASSAFAQNYDLNTLIEDKANKHRVSPNLIRAVMSTESALKRTALSPKGAKGLMQLMPATAELMGIPRSQLFDPERNIEAGTRYLAKLQGIFGNNIPFIAAAYNAGEGAVKKYGGIPPYRETQNYVPQVVNKFNLFNSCGVSCFNNMHKGRATSFEVAKVSEQPKHSGLDAWLGGTTQTKVVTANYLQDPLPAQGAIQTSAVRVQVTPSTNVFKPQQVARRSNGFVQTLMEDGTYQVVQ